MHLAYIALLTLAVPFAIFRGGATLQLCAGLIAGNWIINSLWVEVTLDFDPAHIFLATDAACLVLILRFATSGWGQSIASTYVGQILMHFVHLGGEGDPLYYWRILTLLAFAQLFLLIGWGLSSPAYRSADRGTC